MRSDRAIEWDGVSRPGNADAGTQPCMPAQLGNADVGTQPCMPVQLGNADVEVQPCMPAQPENARTRIKLCGLTRPEDIWAANECRPDYIGFVFAKKSRRYVDPETAASLKELLCPEIQAVGVFVNEKPETIARFLREGIIDLAQLHGNETKDDIQKLRRLTSKPLLQAFSVNDAWDMQKATDSGADFLLLDSGAGGTGKTFDWELLLQMQRPYFLAGGLGAENVKDALWLLHPYGVDVSSGVETNGRKDPQKMTAFVRAVRETDHVRKEERL